MASTISPPNQHPHPHLLRPSPPQTTTTAATSMISPSPIPFETPLTQDDLKKMAAYKAVELVKSGMVLGLGTGSTAYHAVNRIGELLHQGTLKNIIGIPTSLKTKEQAISLGIPISDLDSYPVLDLAIDGADEVDPGLNLVKGRGGSLLREKMIEGASKKLVVIVDETKLVEKLGSSTGLSMPVEVVPFCWGYTAECLKRLFRGCEVKLRIGSDGKPFKTDNENYIVEMFFGEDIGDLNVASDKMHRIVGVVEHGMFIDMATTVIVAGERGITVKHKAL